MTGVKTDCRERFSLRVGLATPHSGVKFDD